MNDTNNESFDAAEQKAEKQNDTQNARGASSPGPPQAAYSEETEILDEQFQNYLLIGKALLKTLKRPRDIEICTILLRKVQRLNESRQVEIRRYNNCFLRYCLRILKWTSDNQLLELYKLWYQDQENIDNTIESSVWLEENKSYMALKRLKDGSIVMYAAITDDPSAHWHNGGLNFLAKRGLCLRNI